MCELDDDSLEILSLTGANDWEPMGLLKGHLIDLDLSFKSIWAISPHLQGYPLVTCYIAIENVPFTVGLTIQNSDFP
jgi:hypothetical protein